MKNGILVYIAGAICLFFGCYIGGFWGGFIFGITGALLLLATVGRWQYARATDAQDAHIEKLISALKNAKDDNAATPGS